jgi:hypothetical protein
LLNLDQAEKNSRNKAYTLLQNISKQLNDQNITDLLNSEDPQALLEQILQNQNDELQYLSALTPHAILSMIKEINNA